MSEIRDEQCQLKSLKRQLLLNKLFGIANIEGKKELTDFLELTWNLRKMPSTDYRFKNAKDDIWQHMIRNPEDWGEGYESYHYLFDSYLGLYNGTDTQFFQFLETTVNPLIREGEEQEAYISAINEYLIKEGAKLEISEEIEGYSIYRIIKLNDRVKGSIKNLIFASNGPKPEIVLVDALNNEIKIVKNAEYCLLYEKPIPATGLLWTDLVYWWAEKQGVSPSDTIESSLRSRLNESLSPNSPPEKLFFDTYFESIYPKFGKKLPALIPQVYLHYDPYTIKQYAMNQSQNNIPLKRQRMDFLLLFSPQERIVIEIDGRQHYSDPKDTAKSDPKEYAKMVSEDRRLRLNGYEIYRFGASELLEENGKTIIIEFFHGLFQKHRITP